MNKNSSLYFGQVNEFQGKRKTQDIYTTMTGEHQTLVSKGVKETDPVPQNL